MKMCSVLLRMLDSDRNALLANPHVRLSGPVAHTMYDGFRKQLEACSSPCSRKLGYGEP